MSGTNYKNYRNSLRDMKSLSAASLSKNIPLFGSQRRGSENVTSYSIRYRICKTLEELWKELLIFSVMLGEQNNQSMLLK